MNFIYLFYNILIYQHLDLEKNVFGWKILIKLTFFRIDKFSIRRLLVKQPGHDRVYIFLNWLATKNFLTIEFYENLPGRYPLTQPKFKFYTFPVIVLIRWLIGTFYLKVEVFRYNFFFKKSKSLIILIHNLLLDIKL